MFVTQTKRQELNQRATATVELSPSELPPRGSVPEVRLQLPKLEWPAKQRTHQAMYEFGKERQAGLERLDPTKPRDYLQLLRNLVLLEYMQCILELESYDLFDQQVTGLSINTDRDGISQATGFIQVPGVSDQMPALYWGDAVIIRMVQGRKYINVMAQVSLAQNSGLTRDRSWK